jgi:hypothetical protein
MLAFYKLESTPESYLRQTEVQADFTKGNCATLVVREIGRRQRTSLSLLLAGRVHEIALT